jgi:excisionase family DNA binding protein
MTELPDHLLDLDGAADYLNVPKSWLEIAVRRRKVGCTRIGKHIRFTRKHIEDIIRVGEQDPVRPYEQKPTSVHRGRARSRL